MDRVRFSSAAALGMAMLVGCGLAAPPAQAGYVVTLTQEGTDVVATGSGPIDLTGLSFNFPSGAAAFISPDSGAIFTGPSSTEGVYTGFTGPGSFGSGGAGSLPAAPAVTSSVSTPRTASLVYR
jgi:hypothetical protein